jgi:hypothetical protein
MGKVLAIKRKDIGRDFEPVEGTGYRVSIGVASRG